MCTLISQIKLRIISDDPVDSEVEYKATLIQILNMQLTRIQLDLLYNYWAMSLSLFYHVNFCTSLPRSTDHGNLSIWIGSSIGKHNLKNLIILGWKSNFM